MVLVGVVGGGRGGKVDEHSIQTDKQTVEINEIRHTRSRRDAITDHTRAWLAPDAGAGSRDVRSPHRAFLQVESPGSKKGRGASDKRPNATDDGLILIPIQPMIPILASLDLFSVIPYGQSNGSQIPLRTYSAQLVKLPLRKALSASLQSVTADSGKGRARAGAQLVGAGAILREQ
jgi:hypothetical protein